MNHNDTPEGHGKNCCSSSSEGVMWWATLVVAVLAVPSLAVIVVVMTGSRGFMSVAVFMIACWLCTWLGMRLMKNPKMSEKIDFTKKP